jgi:ATP-dependent Clp protease ATP-binding subunit ClpC
VFEKYTERARRILFFARYEASQFGSVEINSDHLLLGLIREGRGLTNRLFAHSHVSLEELRKEIEGRAVFREKVPTSVEMPFADEVRRVLTRTAEEATRLKHDYIGSEHLLLGLLREEHSLAGSLLIQKGMRADTVSETLVQLLNERGKNERLESWESRQCCFCGKTFLEPSFAVLLQISHATGEEGSQYLFAHPHCLRTRVRADVPLITDTDDGEVT